MPVYVYMWLQIGGGEGHYEDIGAVELPIDDLVAMSTPFQDSSMSIIGSNRTWIIAVK